MVEDMLAYKGIIVTHKTVREWAENFGRAYANKMRRRTARPGDKWHLDEVVISMAANIGCGVLLIRMASYWKYLSRNAVIPRPRSDPSANYSQPTALHPCHGHRQAEVICGGQ